ncbi:MAG: carboxypeptidase-like regulatory domain-containing protein [Terracidiphilus sp.]
MLTAILALVVCPLAVAQAPQQDSQAANPGSASLGTPTTVHGIVRNGASGDPLPSALVRINGDASTGVLTDGDGRFEIPDIPSGPQDFTVVKPGFIDQVEAAADSDARNQHGFGHNVMVISQMGDIVFTMVPLNSIEGMIQLSTGDVAEGIQVTLLRRTVQDGRVVWQTELGAKTNVEGIYRFGELSDGLYAVYTEPTMESNSATNLVETGSGNNVEREGYASTFYPDARDLAGAAKIKVAGGEQAQANINLTLEPFHSVTATATMPKASTGAADDVAVQVMNAQGHSLPYPAQYDAATHMVQANLPDGAYTFLASLQTNMPHVVSTRNGEVLNLATASPRPVRGEVSFAVAGRAVSGLQDPLSELGGNSIQVIMTRNPNSSAKTGDPNIYVTLTQTGGWMGDGMVGAYAEGSGLAPLQTQHPPPGSYWVHIAIGSKTVCEGSFTAGGASLAREPLVLNSSGTTAPLVLSLRDDCAALTLSLPGSVGSAAGEEPFYTAYVVPDFDSTEDVVPQTLRLSTGGRIKITGLTPGNYHVYTFDRLIALAYRDPAVLASLPGQAVTLSPDADADLTLEVPQR